MASPEIPSEMHAWTHTSRGPPTRVLHLVSNVPVRHPKTASEILVKVSYAALNPGGAIMMHFVPFILRHSPAVPEMDFSGVVVELGPATENDSLTGGAQESSFKVGDRVFGSIEVPTHVGGGHGALAEYVVVNPKHCCRAPANAKMEELAGLGIAGTTALRLIKTAEPWLKPGAKVLVNGASGGIGSLVVQLAKNVVGDSGLVVAVCSARNRDLVLGLGPDAIVDYTAHANVGHHLGNTYGSTKFDLVIDAIGIQTLWETCPLFLSPNGGFVTVGIANKDYTWSSMFQILWLMMLKNPFTPTVLGGVPRKLERIMATVSEDTMRELGQAVEEGRLKGVVGQIWEMEDVKSAYGVLIQKRAKGKIVVRIGG